MTDTKIFLNGRIEDLSAKATISIPGWAVNFKRDVGAYSKSPWANRCIQIRMSAMSGLPWEIAKEDGPVEDTELEALLVESKFSELVRHTEADLLIHGRAYWVKALAGNRVVGLRRLNAGTMEAITSSQGISSFRQQLDWAITSFSTEEIVYFHEFDPDNDLDGVALVDVAKSAIESEYNADRYIAAFFDNYAMPSIIFSTEADLPETEAKKAEAWWRRLFGGAQNQHKTAFVGRGLTPTVVSFSPDKLALEGIRAEARRSICAAFGVPPTVANAADPGSYATADEQRQSLYEELIVPRGKWYAEQINEQVTSLFDPSLMFRYKFDDLPTLQEDLNAKATRLALLSDAGIIKPEVAAMEMGYAPEEAGVGRPQQFGGFGLPEEEPEPEPKSLVTSPTELVEPTSPAILALSQWRKKSLKRLKAGKSPAVKFVSVDIPQARHEAILGQLEAAEGHDDVEDVFRKALEWIDYPVLT